MTSNDDLIAEARAMTPMNSCGPCRQMVRKLADALEASLPAPDGDGRSEMSEEQIERAARAIRDDQANREQFWEVPEWDKTPHGSKELYRAKARAALTAAGVAPVSEGARLIDKAALYRVIDEAQRSWGTGDRCEPIAAPITRAVIQHLGGEQQ